MGDVITLIINGCETMVTVSGTYSGVTNGGKTEKLIGQAASFDPRFGSIFPNNTKEEKHLFDLLRRAYVDARYSKSYRITDEELDEIGKRIGMLKTVTVEVCNKNIEDLRRAAVAMGEQ